MEKNSEVDKILFEAGIDFKSLMLKEKQELCKTLRQSREETHGGSSLSDSREVRAFSREDNISILNELEAGTALGKKKLDQCSPNQGNKSIPPRVEEAQQELSPSRETNYSGVVARSPVEKQNITPPFKCAPGLAKKNIDQNPNSSHRSNASSSNDNFWLESGNNKENNTYAKKSTPVLKEDSKPGEICLRESENSSDIKTLRSDSKCRESPENMEVPCLNSLVFKSRNPTSFFSELAFLPPLHSLSREEWVRTACQTLLARKVAQMEKTQGSRWVTLLERNINIASLENAVAKASAQHSKDDGSTNLNESSLCRHKLRSSPENTVEDGVACSPDVVIDDAFPGMSSVKSEGLENAAMSSSECTKPQVKIDRAVSSSVGRSDDCGGHDRESTRRKSGRNRAKRGRGGFSQSISNDDISNRAQGSSGVGKQSDNFTASTSNNSPTEGNSPAGNIAEVQQECPMCKRVFYKLRDLQDHAWNCDGPTVEGENQVAENGGRSDETESKRRKFFSTEEEDEEVQIVDKMNSVFRKIEPDKGDHHLFGVPSPKYPNKHANDGGDFVTRTSKSCTRKRNLIPSDDEEFSSKSPRK